MYLRSEDQQGVPFFLNLLQLSILYVFRKE